MGKATLKFIRLSPIKARLVAREVQGMNAEVAIASLEFTPNKAAGVIAKVIASAVANSGRHPVTPWGMPTKGYKTRKKKASDKLIISRRKK